MSYMTGLAMAIGPGLWWINMENRIQDQTKYPWKNYPYPVYWDLPDDGALFKCSDCGIRVEHNKAKLTQIPSGKREVVCDECLDPHWKKMAKNLGPFKD